MNVTRKVSILAGIVALSAGVTFALNVSTEKKKDDFCPVKWKEASASNFEARGPLLKKLSNSLIGKSEEQVLSILGQPEIRGFRLCGYGKHRHERLTYTLSSPRPLDKEGLVTVGRSHNCDTFVICVEDGKVVEAEVVRWSAMADSLPFPNEG